MQTDRCHNIVNRILQIIVSYSWFVNKIQQQSYLLFVKT